MDIGHSQQVVSSAERVLRALQPTNEWPHFEVDLTQTMTRSFATGMAAAYIGEYPAHPSITLYARLGVGPERLLVGTFDTLLLRLTFSKSIPTAVVEKVVERLGGQFDTVLSVRTA